MQVEPNVSAGTDQHMEMEFFFLERCDVLAIKRRLEWVLGKVLERPTEHAALDQGCHRPVSFLAKEPHNCSYVNCS